MTGPDFSSLPAAEIEALTGFAGELADLARTVIKPYFRQPIPVDVKADKSPVTEADREAERQMRVMIGDRFPDHGVVGEEFPDTAADAAFVWVLDPIDGTKSFVSGNPLFGTLIGLLYHGRPVLGIIDHLATDERWLGVAGQPTSLNGRPVKCRACPSLSLAVKYTYGIECYRGDEAAAFNAVGAEVAMTRFSADCYAYGLLATGFVDVVMEDTMNPWDFTALIPVITGAGGVITDWQGNALNLDSDGRVLAVGDAARHQEILSLISNS